MSHRFARIPVLVLLVSLFFVMASASDRSTEYMMAVGDYFKFSYDDVRLVSEMVSDIEEIPVVFFMAERARLNPLGIARFRQSGQSWSAINNTLGLTPSDFYVIVNRDFKSKAFSPIFEKYKNTDAAKWSTISLTDDDINNLVNLKLMYSHYDYSVFDIMAMRDYGKSYTRINQQVKESKRKQLQKQVASRNNGDKK